jgi:hypothetical protein
MRFLRKLSGFVFRACIWMLSFASGIVVIFLAGYWLGWKSTSEEAPPLETPAEIAAAPSQEASQSTRRRARTSQQRRETIASLLVSKNGERVGRTHLVARIAMLNVGDVQDFIVALETAPASQMYLELRRLLLERWTTLDPRAAFDYVRSSARKNESGELFSSVIRRWAFYDASAALEAWRELRYAEAFEDRYDRQRSDFHGLHDIFLRLGSQDLNRAIAETRTLLPEQQAAAWRAISELAAGDERREQLLGAILALPAGEVRSEALARAVDTWRRSGHETEALQWLDSATIDRAEKSKVEMQIAMSGFFDGNRESAANWLVDRAQTQKERSDRLRQMVMNWAHDDPVACGNWLIKQGLDESASAAMSIYARNVSSQHPADALAWARSIQNETVRQRALAEVETRIRHYHPNQADSLLAKSSSQ